MTRGTKVLVAIGVVVVLAIVGYRTAYPTYVWRQKLTLEFDMPNGPMSAGTDEVRPRLARVYALPMMTSTSRIRPSSARRRARPMGLGLATARPGATAVTAR